MNWFLYHRDLRHENVKSFLGLETKSLVFSFVLPNFNHYPLSRMFFEVKSLKEIKKFDERLSLYLYSCISLF